MNIKSVLSVFIGVFLILSINSCDSSIEKECIAVIQKRYGNQEGFKVLKSRADKASTVKLALGEYDAQTETIVSVDFETDTLKEQYCSCLMDIDGDFIVTSDEIKYE